MKKILVEDAGTSVSNFSWKAAFTTNCVCISCQIIFCNSLNDRLIVAAG